jgi:hypothetical protein
MKPLRKRLAAAGLSLLFLAAWARAMADDPTTWPVVTAQARPWIWWWWHGSAVDQTNLTRELNAFRDAGLGGVQITSIYGTQGAEAREIPYLSPAWLAMMGYTVEEANKLGLGVDMSLGSGWCFGGPTVSDRNADAKVMVDTFKLGPGQGLTNHLQVSSVQAVVAFSAKGDCRDVTGKLHRDGNLDWRAPTVDWSVYVITQKPSGQKVKRAAQGGEGWMLNPFYPRAVQDWLRWFDRALAGYRGAKPAAVFQDSYEYHTDWAPDFFAQFKKRRGYALQTELPALFGANTDEQTARVKYDYRRTVADILAGQSEPAWIKWAHRKGFATIYQAHGTPGNWLDLYGEADLPETEMFHRDRSILISKFASSAAHTQGRLLTGAETGTWLQEHFTETLADLKGLADDMFLAGVNHLYYHGACYSPADAPWPGWLFYASTEMNARNPIWGDVGALNNYVTRCQSVLQSGRPDNEVLIYWPVADFWSDPAGLIQPMGVSEKQWFEGQPIGELARELWSRGYGFDYVSDAQLLKAKVAAGRIRMPGGDYAIVVVPRCRYMPWETIDRLAALAKAGANVSFVDQLPTQIAGWHQADGNEKYRTLRKRYSLDGASVPDIVDGHRVGQGWFLLGDPLAALALARVPRETMVDSGLVFERRTVDHNWTYFIANRARTNFDGWVSLARQFQSAALLDPLTGDSGLARIQPSAGSELPRIHLQLAPGESVIVRALTDSHIEGRPWTYWRSASEAAETQTLTGVWKVSFLVGGPGLPKDGHLDRLDSWTTLADPAAQAFAGTARYESEFDAPDPAGKSFVLDLGEVCQSARVRVNGQDYGTLIAPPFRVVVDHLKPAGNRLEVEVTSVAANRIRDLDRRGVKWKVFKDINLVDVQYQPFNAADWPLTACGLLGPVTLTTVAPE